MSDWIEQLVQIKYAKIEEGLLGEKLSVYIINSWNLSKTLS